MSNIQFKINIDETGWAYYYFTVDGETYRYCRGTSDSWADGNALLESICGLSPLFEYTAYEAICDWEKDLCTAIEWEYDESYNNTSAEFMWSDGGWDTKWTLKRLDDNKENPTISIAIENWPIGILNSVESFTVEYKELCYAVAKGYTEALLKHGIRGYLWSTYVDEFPIRYLLFIKAVALDRMDVLEFRRGQSNPDRGYLSDIKKELELLIEEM